MENIPIRGVESMEINNIDNRNIESEDNKIQGFQRMTDEEWSSGMAFIEVRDHLSDCNSIDTIAQDHEYLDGSFDWLGSDDIYDYL